ncbi:transposase, mutator type [Streptomyces lincolnensis]|nr:transposase [Streptomyces lincolnensis]AXG53752.1 transposase, mutator type [Streptomyces lincolnensis]
MRLLESLRSTEGPELVRSIAERVMQELIDAETTAKIGAEWNEHTEARTNYRNGHRDNTLTIQAGDLCSPNRRKAAPSDPGRDPPRA